MKRSELRNGDIVTFCDKKVNYIVMGKRLHLPNRDEYIFIEDYYDKELNRHLEVGPNYEIFSIERPDTLVWKSPSKKNITVLLDGEQVKVPQVLINHYEDSVVPLELIKFGDIVHYKDGSMTTHLESRILVRRNVDKVVRPGFIWYKKKSFEIGGLTLNRVDDNIFECNGQIINKETLLKVRELVKYSYLTIGCSIVTYNYKTKSFLVNDRVVGGIDELDKLISELCDDYITRRTS